MGPSDRFEAQRERLIAIATRILADASEAEDLVQQAWLRLDRTDTEIEDLPAWLTTTTVRLCLDRLRARTPVPVDGLEPAGHVPGPAGELELAADVGSALGVVLDRLTPAERVALVLHDSFDVDFASIAAVLDTTPGAARKLASRARGKAAPREPEAGPADWEVVDAFLAAAREGEFARLLALLAPGAVIAGDPTAILAGTPERIEGREEVARFFDGAARTALPVFVEERPGAAWFLRGQPRVAFDFTIRDGCVARIDFRAEPGVLAGLTRRAGTGRSHRGVDARPKG